MGNQSKMRLPLIRSLMIIAQVLLVVLSMHWLNMQYKEQKQMLVNDISRLWLSAQQQMVDSLLLTHYINPALDSSTRFDFKFEFNTDSLKSHTTHEQATLMRMEVPTIEMPAEESRIIVKVSDSLHVNTITTHRGPSFVKRDLVLKGVKLFVNEFSDTTGPGMNMPEWAFESDTNIFKSSFIEKVSELYPEIRVKWKTRQFTDSSFRMKGPPPKLQMIAGDQSIEADLGGYRWLVFSKILPQIGFALLLIILTALAFLISHRSLKTQALLNEQRNDFIRNMSHEIKTPVATVKVALEALKKYDRRKDPQIMEEYLEMATSEIERLGLLINRVMNVADQGEVFLLNLEETNIKELTLGVLTTLKPGFENENVTINLEMTDDECLLHIDPLHIRGVLINLLDNSLKYCQPPVKISISILTKGDFIQLEVSDNGQGIPETYRNRIFEKFFRVPSGDVHTIKGYGLGLSYARSVMEHHKGSIEYRPANPTGSVFTLSFPKYSV